MREKLAELAHQQWSGWMEYLFSKCTFNDDGTATIPTWAVERWQRQIVTPFAELPSDEQEADLREADRVLEICIKRLEAYALSLEVSRHIGLPDPISAIHEIAQRLRR